MTKPNVFLLFLYFILLGGCATEPTLQPKAVVFQSDMDKSSYTQGVRYMESLRQFDIPLDQPLFIQGMNDVLAKRPYQLTPVELQQGQAWVLIQQDLYNEKLGKANLEKSRAFLDKNKQQPGVVALPSGLQYKVIVRGNGQQKPTINDAVSVHYRINRISGEKLTESGKDETAPSVLLVKNLIKGWQEGLQLMSEGDKWLLFIPPSLAYGEAGVPPGGVGPNETLVYEVELVDVKDTLNDQARKTISDEIATPAVKKITSW
jgi:FKBP-type peptidyl-prolyl cis-trans isomerase FklB